MKSLLVIGMGRFGSRLALKLCEMDNDVMIIDKNEECVEKMASVCTDAQIGDCTNIEVLRALGVRNFDICFVTIGDNFQASLEITSLLKELGAKYVISKADSDIQRKFLLRNGADEVVYPTKEVAERLAIRSSAKNMFDFIELSPGYSISELPMLSSWEGRSIADIDVRKKYGLTVLAIKKGETMMPISSAGYVFESNDHVILLGKTSEILKFSSKT